MIASGYEKAGRGWTNSLLPNGMKSVSAHPAVISVPDVRLRATDTPAMGIRSRLRRAQTFGFTSGLALRVGALSGVIPKVTGVCGVSQGGLAGVSFHEHLNRRTNAGIC